MMRRRADMTDYRLVTRPGFWQMCAYVHSTYCLHSQWCDAGEAAVCNFAPPREVQR